MTARSVISAPGMGCVWFSGAGGVQARFHDATRGVHSETKFRVNANGEGGVAGLERSVGDRNLAV